LSFVVFGWLSTWLFYLNHPNYGLLIARVILFPQELMSDLSDSRKGPGFLTVVAGSGMLGVQYCLFSQHYTPALVLW
jgi:hypothetical protein